MRRRQKRTATITTNGGTTVQISKGTLEDYLALGFCPKPFTNQNGKGSLYPAIKAHLPRPRADGKRVKMPLARVLLAIIMEREGQRLPAKGWVVGYRDGDRLNLTDENLFPRPAKGSRNGYEAAWSVRERFCLLDRGCCPGAVLEARARATRCSRSRVNPCLNEQINHRVPPSAPVAAPGVSMP